MDAADFRIVLNYRRDDTGGYAGHLYDALSERFGDDHVFIDIDKIRPGMEFAEVIDQAVGSADVFLALIGRRWLTATDAGGRRLDSPGDLVRLEIEAALEREVTVIPVLFQGAEMPSSADLPETLSRLAGIHAHEISDSRWGYDITQLIATLEEIERQKRAEKRAPVAPPAPPAVPTVDRDRPRPSPPVSTRHARFVTPRRALLAGAGVAGVALVALLVTLLLDGGEPEPAPFSPDGLVFSRNGSIFLIDDGKPVDLGEGSWPDRARDGRIAFIRDSRIWMINEERNDPVPLRTGPGSDGAPAWSPDGVELFFDRKTSEDSRSNIYEVTLANGDPSSDPVQVTTDGGAAPDVSGEGKIVFQRDMDIWISEDGDEENISEMDSNESKPTWSPDGAWIAFRVVQGETSDIWIMNPDGGEKKNLTERSSIHANNPSWSSDGKWIVIEAPDGIWVTDPNGKAPERVVECKQDPDPCEVISSPNP
jgi:hypothetical protein